MQNKVTGFDKSLLISLSLMLQMYHSLGLTEDKWVSPLSDRKH